MDVTLALRKEETVGVCSRTVLSAKEVESQEEVEFSSVCQVLTPRSSEIKSQELTGFHNLEIFARTFSKEWRGRSLLCFFGLWEDCPWVQAIPVFSRERMTSCLSVCSCLFYSLSFGCSLGSKPALDSLFLFVIKTGLSHRVSDLSSVYLFWKLSFISPQMR